MKTNSITGIITILAISIALQASAQEFGIAVGSNLSNVMFNIDSDYGEEPHIKMKLGPQFGIMMDYEVTDSFSVYVSFLYTNKGYCFDIPEELENQNYDVDNFKGYQRYNYNYLEIPINAVYRVGNSQFFAGPYVALGVNGKLKIDWSCKVDGEKVNSDDIFDKKKYKLKPVFGTVNNDEFKDFIKEEENFDFFRAIDYGFIFGFGYRIEDVLLKISYSHGLANMTPNYDVQYQLNQFARYDIDEDYTDNVILKNRVLSFSAVFYFNQ